MAATIPPGRTDQTLVPDYKKLYDLTGRVMVVLGGGNGIGRQTCHALAQAGATVVCVDRDQALADAVAAEVKDSSRWRCNATPRGRTRLRGGGETRTHSRRD